VHHAKVELLDEEALLGLEVGHPHGDVVAAHGGEEAGRVEGGRVLKGHGDGSLVERIVGPTH
jgi:hypothetical protein